MRKARELKEYIENRRKSQEHREYISKDQPIKKKNNANSDISSKFYNTDFYFILHFPNIFDAVAWFYIYWYRMVDECFACPNGIGLGGRPSHLYI